MDTMGLTLSPSDPLFSLIVSIPDFHSNTVGSIARENLINKMASCTPGRHTEPYYMPKGKTFRQIFFPDYRSAPYAGDVTSVTGLDDRFWTDFSVAMLCQSMYYQTSDIRQQLLIDKISNAVDAMNASLRDRLLTWYTYVIFHYFMRYSGDPKHAKEVYISQLDNEYWVTYKMKQYTEGTWDNPDWELYHHWVKLSALGASNNEILKLIKSLKERNLHIPNNVSFDSWYHYVAWYRPDHLYHEDIDDSALPGQLERVCTPVMGSIRPVCISEENCFEFTATSQPGNLYRGSAASSCFSSNTKVLMGDGSVREIKDIRPGHVVRTPSGSQKVMVVTTPYRGDRVLYGFNNHDFYFTSGHPFSNGKEETSFPEPRYLAVSPLQVINDVPTIGYVGIGTLEVGCHLLDDYKRPVRVESVQQYQSSNEDEQVYDLILEPNDETGLFEYMVGDGRGFFIVASELPITKGSTQVEQIAFNVTKATVDLSSNSLERLLNTFGYDIFLEKLYTIVRRVQQSLVVAAKSPNLPEPISGRSETRLKSLEGTPLIQSIMESSKIFLRQNMSYNLATGVAFDFLIRKLLGEISSCLQLGFRVIPDHAQGDILSISLLDLQVISSPSFFIPPEPNITVEVEGHFSRNMKVEDGWTFFGGRIHRIFYVPLYELSKGGLWIKFHVRAPRDGTIILSATKYISLPTHHSYKYYRLPLFTTDKSEFGYMNVDVRHMSPSLIRNEEANLEAWNENAQMELADLLLFHGSELISKLCQQFISQE